MILRFVLDTNVLSEPLKPNPRPAILRRLEQFREGLATSAPVWHELVFGCMRLPPSARRQALERYIKDTLAPSLPVLPYDADAAAWHAGERARLEALGKTPPFVDGQIAAVARVRGLVLVTRNVSDYADFEGLLIDDWAA